MSGKQKGVPHRRPHAGGFLTPAPKLEESGKAIDPKEVRRRRRILNSEYGVISTTYGRRVPGGYGKGSFR